MTVRTVGNRPLAMRSQAMRSQGCIRFLPVIIGSVALTIASCARPTASDPNSIEQQAPPPAQSQPAEPMQVSQGTRRMVNRLAQINAQADPKLNYHLNNRRAAEIRDAMEGKTGTELVQLRFNYGVQLLNAGQTKKAIKTFEELLDSTGDDESRITDGNRLIFEMLAMAHLRRGEQENCVANHSPESCILPISGRGVHVLPAGSQQAATIYEKILASRPDDLQSQWLLNLAYMTLGEHPEGVPPRWRIPGLQATDAPSFPKFLDVAMATRVDVTGLSGGACVEDFDNDGDLDIFCSSYGLTDQVRLFLNRGDGTFQQATEQAGLTGIVSGLNTLHADYNNDGFVDILILRGAWLGAVGEHPNSLLKNQGDGTFQDVTFAAGLTGEHPTQTAAFGDFNLDGWLDLFVGNESTKSNSHPCELYLNKQDGTFQEVASTLGLDFKGFVKGVLWGDFDNDGLPDLYLSNLTGPNKLYRNRGGTSIETWGFEDVTDKAGVAKPFFSFPGWFWDYDNDGWQDLFVASYQINREHQVGGDFAAELLGHPIETELPRLYKNQGDGTFADVTPEAAVNRVMYAMGSNYGDLDSDGWQDFYVGTGAPDLRSVIPNRMFRNRDGRRFEEVTFPGGFGHIQKGHAVAFGDLDNDGDQDIYCVMGGAFEGDVFQNVLFENPGNQNHWITLHLVGTHSNRSAIGARVRVTVETLNGRRREIHRTVRTGGTFGASSLQLEIGLGDSYAIREIQVRWPSRGAPEQSFTNAALDQAYQIIEGRDELIPLSRMTFELGRANH